MEQKVYVVNNEQDMQNLVIEVLSKLKGPTRVLALSGELGAGKTTFTKALAKELSIEEDITSPTFVIQKSYKTPKSCFGVKKLVHIDAYRLEDERDLEALDFSITLAEKGTLVVIEWAENIKAALPKRTITLNFEYVDETTRKVSIDGILD
jgi:tRNA threonylcarbamoyladenosine biosynthesis protein TsaE